MSNQALIGIKDQVLRNEITNLLIEKRFSLKIVSIFPDFFTEVANAKYNLIILDAALEKRTVVGQIKIDDIWDIIKAEVLEGTLHFFVITNKKINQDAPYTIMKQDDFTVEYLENYLKDKVM